MPAFLCIDISIYFCLACINLFRLFCFNLNCQRFDQDTKNVIFRLLIITCWLSLTIPLLFSFFSVYDLIHLRNRDLAGIWSGKLCISFKNNFHIPSAELIRLYDPKSVDIEGEIAIICLRLVKITIISVSQSVSLQLLFLPTFSSNTLSSLQFLSLPTFSSNTLSSLKFYLLPTFSSNAHSFLQLLILPTFSSNIRPSLHLLFLPTLSSNTLSSLQLLFLPIFSSNILSLSIPNNLTLCPLSHLLSSLPIQPPQLLPHLAPYLIIFLSLLTYLPASFPLYNP